MHVHDVRVLFWKGVRLPQHHGGIAQPQGSGHGAVDSSHPEAFFGRCLSSVQVLSKTLNQVTVALSATAASNHRGLLSSGAPALSLERVCQLNGSCVLTSVQCQIIPLWLEVSPQLGVTCAQLAGRALEEGYIADGKCGELVQEDAKHKGASRSPRCTLSPELLVLDSTLFLPQALQSVATLQFRISCFSRKGP
eukprot:4062280-Amphidinium_carterae.1